MTPDAIAELFDQQAAGYDRQWARTAAIRECLYLLLDALFQPLPEDSRVLCVGAGTGMEVAHLAGRFPHWRFTVVEPSGAMLDACRQRADAEGFIERCSFHHGFLDTLPPTAPHQAATSFLVSQFILDPAERRDFFAAIAARLAPDGLLASSDLASDVASPEYRVLLPAWTRMLAAAEVPPDALQRIREAYSRDVAVLPVAEVTAIIAAGGFEHPTLFFQAGLIHAWVSRRSG